jgi:asparagine synthase (glutamine-hydrolysing)
MSGIVAVLRTDGAPLRADVLAPSMESLSFRGPHGSGVWQRGPAALGHTLLRSTREAWGDVQPLAAEDRVWIVADARIDARAELIAKLPVRDRDRLAGAADVELVLRAYLQWGEACVDHLLGDFAFALWDAAEQRLFCARDHMGVKPFYYAHASEWLIVSNVLDCVRRHPAVSDTLNDLAMADCLLFGSNRTANTTVYRDIQRLPAGHTLTWSPDGLKVRRYWSLPIDEPVYYRHDLDYVERFNELLHQAVADRLRVDRVGIFMSGGIDSTLLAGASQRLLAQNREPAAVRAYTFVHTSLLSDSEQPYAQAVARHLDIPLSVCPIDQDPQWLGAGTPRTPEPLDDPTDFRPQLRVYSTMAEHSPVAFFGEGPDNALQYEWRPHLAYLFRQRRWRRLAADIVKHIRIHRRIPLLPTIPRMFREQLHEPPEERFPEWLNPRLAESLDLRDRWHALRSCPSSEHPTRPMGYASLVSPMWQGLFESLDTAYTGAPLEVRHPFIDIRLLRFMLSLPALPWCRVKHIARCAARPLLPPQVWSRPKTPLSDVPAEIQMRRYGAPSIYPSSELDIYTALQSIPHDRSPVPLPAFAHLRLAALSYWLSTRAPLARSA